MIAFDNGPDQGDYVRYIDDLMKRGAIASAAGTLPGGEASRTLARQDGVATGFAAPAAPTASATAAAAIAAALAGGQAGRSLPVHTKVGLAAIALGVVLIVVGLVTPLNVVLIVGGGAVIAWAVRMMRDAAARA